MVVLLIARFEGIAVPVVAARADADDASLAVVGGIFPGNDSAVAANAEDFTTSAGLPGSVVIVATPVGADVVLGGGVGDMIAGIGAINLLRVVALDKILPHPSSCWA